MSGGGRGREKSEQASVPPRVHSASRWPGAGGQQVSWAPGRSGGTASLVPLLEEQEVHLLERGALLGVPPPAAQHQLVHGVGADGRLREVSLPERNEQKRRRLGRGAGRGRGLAQCPPSCAVDQRGCCPLPRPEDPNAGQPLPAPTSRPAPWGRTS